MPPPHAALRPAALSCAPASDLVQHPQPFKTRLDGSGATTAGECRSRSTRPDRMRGLPTRYPGWCCAPFARPLVRHPPRTTSPVPWRAEQSGVVTRTRRAEPCLSVLRGGRWSTVGSRRGVDTRCPHRGQGNIDHSPSHIACPQLVRIPQSTVFQRFTLIDSAVGWGATAVHGAPPLNTHRCRCV